MTVKLKLVLLALLFLPQFPAWGQTTTRMTVASDR